MTAPLPDALPPHATTLVFHTSRNTLYAEFMAHLLSSCGGLLGLEMLDIVLCESPKEVVVNFTSHEACRCAIEMIGPHMGDLVLEISLAPRQGLRSNLAYFFKQPIPHERFAKALHVLSEGRELPLRVAHARHLGFELAASGPGPGRQLQHSDARSTVLLREEPAKLPWPHSFALGGEKSRQISGDAEHVFHL
ncbi:unnamed protein product [Symbiodinium natans]|uniref:Uncharacterized protein n=1 Tax=Symbiodinium natans TaxID=878477 RepID=A0A812UEW4_9DINO|nr:unnamed protein product [Symbiodinium natans]